MKGLLIDRQRFFTHQNKEKKGVRFKLLKFIFLSKNK